MASHLQKCLIIQESDEAIKILVEDKMYWIPLSCITKIVRYPKDPSQQFQKGEVHMSFWIARKKGLLDASDDQ